MKNKCQLLLAIVFLGALWSSCGQSESSTPSAGQTIEVIHKLGKTNIPTQPSKLVVFDIGALETLSELGIKPTAIPKKHLPAYLSHLRIDDTILDVGSMMEPDFEMISGINPDLILISTRQERYYEELSDLAPTVFIGASTADYLPSFIENTRLLGRIVGKEAQAEEKLDLLLDKIEQARERFETDPQQALFLIYNSGRFSAYGKSSRFGFIHDVLHLKPVMKDLKESVHGQRVSNEMIAEANPDYLFIVDRNAAVLGQKANHAEIENALIRMTKAYKNQQVHYLDPNVWFISGGGLVSVNLMVDDIEALL